MLPTFYYSNNKFIFVTCLSLSVCCQYSFLLFSVNVYKQVPVINEVRSEIKLTFLT